MNFKNFISVNLQGDTLQWTPKVKKVQTATKAQKDPNTSTKNYKPARNITRKLYRRKNRLAKTLQTIKNKPKHFISLILDNSVGYEESFRLHISFFKKFLEYLRKKYPKSYFVCVLGWSPATKLHFHMIGRFNIKCTKQEVTQELSQIWGKISGSYHHKAIQISKYNNARHLGYLTSPKKNQEMYTLIHKLGKGRSWTIFNKKNIKWHKQKTINLTPEEWHFFSHHLARLIRKANLPISNIQQLCNVNGCANYIPQKLIKQAYKKLTKWRSQSCQQTS